LVHAASVSAARQELMSVKLNWPRETVPQSVPVSF